MTVAPAASQARIESADAANGLFERYHDRIYAFCMSRTRNPTDAEDATQTAFMHALNGLQRGVVPQFELTWLLRIAENVCHSMHRRAYRRYERDELPADVVGDNDDSSAGRDRFAQLCTALESLPERQRRAVLLREWRGLSYDDIAEDLEVSHAAVETLLFRARRSLVKQLGGFALFPMPLVSRFARWISGGVSTKAAAVTAVTIGATAALVTAPSVPSVKPLGSPNVAAPTEGSQRNAALTSARKVVAPIGARRSEAVVPPVSATSGEPEQDGGPSAQGTPVAAPDPAANAAVDPVEGVESLLPLDQLPLDPGATAPVVVDLVESTVDELEHVTTELQPLTPATELPFP
jgi:RNA polymerase sigma-70 factor (ECF subfamily)